MPSEITFERTETNWVCMIVFLCAHVRISISAYSLYWQALLFIYRIGLHQVTPLGVVFLFMLVNWWVEKHKRFLFNVYIRFFYFCHVFTFLTFFYFFFWNVFYIYGSECPLLLAVLFTVVAFRVCIVLLHSTDQIDW